MKMLILWIIAMVCSSIGFKKFVWFISIGYGFSVAAIGVAMLVLFHGSLTPVTVILALLCCIYGCRLGGYLLMRELKSPSYQKTMKNEVKDGSDMNVFVKCMIWAVCALLYVCETSPLLFRLENATPDNVCGIVGMIIMLCGIVLESASDATKNNFKKKNPKRFCDVGLFRLVRCPNYLGELLTWTGMLISGITVCNGIFQWICAIGGWVCIVYIMFGGARRLELRQNKNYGNDPEYQAYVKSVPIILPFVPLYSVAKYKWLVG